MDRRFYLIIGVYMKMFDNLKSKSIEELTEWLDQYGTFDDSPWLTWWSEMYCENCESIMCRYEETGQEFPCAWCELHDDKCKFFPNLNGLPDNKQIIKMWLESERG